MTAQQRKAANPAHSVWVSANAGSGKTRVLTDRVLRLLLSGVAPHRILCLTYTNAAAAEMALRIQRQLAHWVVSEESVLQDALTQLLEQKPDAATMLRARRLFAQVLDAPEGIRIQTIHALCQSLLRRFTIEADVPSHFRLMEDQETRALFAEAKERLFLMPRQHEENSPLVRAIQQLAETISESLWNTAIWEIISDRAELETLLAKGLEHFQEGLVTLLGMDYRHETEEALIKRHFTYTDTEISQLRALVPVLQSSDKPTDHKMAAALTRWLAWYPDITDSVVEQWLTAMLTAADKQPRAVHHSSFITNYVVKKIPEAREWLGAEVARAVRFFTELVILRNAQMSESFWHIAAALLAIYETLKMQRGLLDYEDLIGKAGQLLTRSGLAPWVLYKLDGGIEHLLVDEAQDTSRIQWQIIEAIASEFFVGDSAAKAPRTLFVVGDEKQSIYSFQGAEPAAFAEMKQLFAQKIKAAQQGYEAVSLSLSFRSSAAVLRAVDAVFQTPEARSGVVQDAQEIQHQAKREVFGRVELWPLCVAEDEDERESWSIPDQHLIPQHAERILAEKIAHTIKQWLQEGRSLAGYNRAIEPRDIMILVRQRGAIFDFLIAALRRHHVPLAGADRLKLSEHIAVQDMLAFAQFLLLPDDDLNLACLLKSPLCGLTEAQLYTLCQGRTGTVWAELRRYQHGVFAEITQRLQQWLKEADYVPPFEMFSKVLEAEGGRKRFIRTMGEEANEPLNEFLALALHYETLHQPSLQGFWHWFGQANVEIKRDMEQSRNEVRILTVHGSKGLEAPIIFLADTTSLPQDKERVLWWESPSHHKGFLWSYASDEDSDIVKALKQQEKDKTLEEYRRLLYVAMTRAADELYIGGVASKKSKGKAPQGSWYHFIEKGMQALVNAQMAEVHQKITPEGEVLETIILADAEEARDLAEKQVREAALPHAPNQPIVSALPTLPDWGLRAAPEEPLPPRPLTPSRPEGVEPAADSPRLEDVEIRKRGVILHRLLEILPTLPATQWEAAGKLLITQAMPRLEGATQQAWLAEVQAILQHPDFFPVFATGSQAEVPITATIEQDGKPRVLSGQLDRLVVTETSVLVVDYKTNRSIPPSAAEIPPLYRQQLTSYAKALAIIYPQHEIKTAILWTAAPLLMPL
jgi:ATP-dependent helicase/nuclease subunit A